MQIIDFLKKLFSSAPTSIAQPVRIKQVNTPRPAILGREIFSATPGKLIDLFTAGDLGFEGGSLYFWGHSLGRPGDSFHKIKQMDFNADQKKLRMTIGDTGILEVTAPRVIEYSHSRLEIRDADCVRWKGSDSEYIFIRNGMKIEVKYGGPYIMDFSDVKRARPAVSIG